MSTQRTIQTESTAPDTSAWRRRLPSSWRAVVPALAGFAVLVRIGLWLAGLVSSGYSLRLSPALYLIWSRWDAPHYLHVALEGYVGHGRNALWIVFFPLYPALVHIAALLTPNMTQAALLVSFGASVAAGWCLFKLVETDASPDEGWRAAILLFSFPTAYFLATPYSEAVFLAAVLASIYAARRGRWWVAALAGMAATASRLTGLAIVPALLAEAMAGPRNGRLKRLAAAAVTPLGFVWYLVINESIFGSPLHFLTVERGRPWYQKAVPPWRPIVEAIQQLGRSSSWSYWFVYPARLAAFALAVAVLIWGWRRLRLSDHVFAWVALAMSLSGARLISLPRYILGLYPLFIVGATKLRSRALFWTVVVLGLLAQGYLFSRYARGLWAF